MSLKKIFEDNKISQKKVANVSKITPAYLNRILAGSCNPTVDVAGRIVKAIKELTGVEVRIEEFVNPIDDISVGGCG